MATTDADVVALCKAFADAGIAIWIDGGWGVDALLGVQTREHGDLDIVVLQAGVADLRALLQSRGFVDAPRPDTSPWNFVLADAAGVSVDVHVIRLDADGNGLYGPVDDPRGAYPAAALQGRGAIAGLPVRCMTADYQIENRRGYALRPSDLHDAQVLAERFAITLPQHLRRTS